MTFGSLFFWFFTGLVGAAYFLYGKKMQEFWFLGAGLGLMLFPMLGFSMPISIVLAMIFIGLPFAAQRWFGDY